MMPNAIKYCESTFFIVSIAINIVVVAVMYQELIAATSPTTLLWGQAFNFRSSATVQHGSNLKSCVSYLRVWHI